MHTQMEHEEYCKISLKSVSKLTDKLTYKSTTSMLTHICDFESYLSTHNGAEGFLLGNIVQPELMHLPWHMMSPQNLRENMYNAFPDFCQVEETNFNSCCFTPIVSNLG